MHEVYFYKDKNGREPIIEYMKELANKKDKDSRIKLNKMNDHIEALFYYIILQKRQGKHRLEKLKRRKENRQI